MQDTGSMDLKHSDSTADGYIPNSKSTDLMQKPSKLDNQQPSGESVSLQLLPLRAIFFKHFKKLLAEMRWQNCVDFVT